MVAKSARRTKLEEFAAKGGKIITSKLEDGTEVNILIEGARVQQDWEEMMGQLSEVRSLKVKQRKLEGEKCFEGAKAAIRQSPPALQQARFLFERARDSFATAAVFDMMVPLRKMQEKIEMLEKNENAKKFSLSSKLNALSAVEDESEKDIYVVDDDDDDVYGADEQDEDVEEDAKDAGTTMNQAMTTTDWETWWKKDMSKVDEDILLSKKIQEMEEREKGEKEKNENEIEVDDDTRRRRRQIEEMIQKELEEQRLAYLQRLEEKKTETDGYF
eukprot:767775-Hanusia_phi.AAC.2